MRFVPFQYNGDYRHRYFQCPGRVGLCWKGKCLIPPIVARTVVLYRGLRVLSFINTPKWVIVIAYALWSSRLKLGLSFPLRGWLAVPQKPQVRWRTFHQPDRPSSAVVLRMYQRRMISESFGVMPILSCLSSSSSTSSLSGGFMIPVKIGLELQCAPNLERGHMIGIFQDPTWE